MDVSNLSPEQFVQLMKTEGQHRIYFVYDSATQRMRVSHPAFQPLGERLLSEFADFQQHEAIFLQVGPTTDALFGVFVHKTNRGQAAGGVRHWAYATLQDLLKDGLRLSLGMGRKNALAGLWWGGGKGIIARQTDRRYGDVDYRRLLYREYGAFISSLSGCYVTAEDVGTRASDMAEVFRTTRFVTCVPPAVGGSGNPSAATARGVIRAMQAALHWAGHGDLSHQHVNVQGLGNVATFMIDQLLELGVAHVTASDISERQVALAAERYASKTVEVAVVGPADTSIYARECDVFAPCALGGVLNPETIPLLRTRVVCGAANNQLLDDRRDDKLLAARGILNVPDFVANRMGIVNCANEQYGIIEDDPAILRHLGREWDNSVYVVTQRILERARAHGITPTEAANALADELMEQPHPIWGHRSRLIIESLVRHSWQAMSPPPA